MKGMFKGVFGEVDVKGFFKEQLKNVARDLLIAGAIKSVQSFIITPALIKLKKMGRRNGESGKDYEFRTVEDILNY